MQGPCAPTHSRSLAHSVLLLPLCLRAARATSDPRPRFYSRWLSKENPDPDGFHLKIVAKVARLYMHEDKDNSPLTAAFAAKGLGAPDFALFCAPLPPHSIPPCHAPCCYLCSAYCARRF